MLQKEKHLLRKEALQQTKKKKHKKKMPLLRNLKKLSKQREAF
jgi:hypothetical protein